MVDIENLRKELERLHNGKRPSSDGLSTQELCGELQMDVKKVRELIRQFSQVGWVTVGKKSMKAIDGRSCVVPAYKIELPAKESKQSGRK